MKTKTLKALRESKNMTLEALSQATGIPIATLFCYEKGKRKVPASKADKIAKALDVNKEKIFLPATFAIRKEPTKSA